MGTQETQHMCVCVHVKQCRGGWVGGEGCIHCVTQWGGHSKGVWEGEGEGKAKAEREAVGVTVTTCPPNTAAFRWNQSSRAPRPPWLLGSSATRHHPLRATRQRFSGLR